MGVDGLEFLHKQNKTNWSMDDYFKSQKKEINKHSDCLIKNIDHISQQNGFDKDTFNKGSSKSYDKYLKEHKENIGTKYPPLPKEMYDEREYAKYNLGDFDYR